VRACVRARVPACVRARVPACVRACMITCVHAFVHACVRACVRAYNMHACVRAFVCAGLRTCVRPCLRVCVRDCLIKSCAAALLACMPTKRAGHTPATDGSSTRPSVLAPPVPFSACTLLQGLKFTVHTRTHSHISSLSPTHQAARSVSRSEPSVIFFPCSKLGRPR